MEETAINESKIASVVSTLMDDYGASILGDTAVGKNVVIGGNAFITTSIPEAEKTTCDRCECTLTLQDGITVSGMMHKDLQFVLEKLATDSDAYKAFAAKGNILSAYSVRTLDSRGNYAPSELWNAGGYRLSIPTNGKSIALIAENSEGKLVTIAADKVENGSAVFTVADITASL